MTIFSVKDNSFETREAKTKEKIADELEFGVLRSKNKQKRWMALEEELSLELVSAIC